MKVCEVCGEDIDGTKDGDNRCPTCENASATINDRRLAKRRRARRAKDDALRSLGLKKVRGALGGVYWE